MSVRDEVGCLNKVFSGPRCGSDIVLNTGRNLLTSLKIKTFVDAFLHGMHRHTSTRIISSLRDICQFD